MIFRMQPLQGATATASE